VACGGLAGAEKKASEERLSIVFIDESGFYLLPGLARTYAPRGERPVIASLLAYDHLSMMSGITREGELHTLVRARSLTSADSVSFLKQLSRRTGQEKLLVIWDCSPIHSGEVARYMADAAAKHIYLERLPAYAPDLNPAEGVWQHLKNVELRNISCKDLNELRYELRLAILRLRSRPQLVRSFFAGAGLDP
jgi:transposase